MKKILIIMMVFVVFGCAKKYVMEPVEDPGKEKTVAEKIGVPEKVEKETVKEDIYAAKEGRVTGEDIADGIGIVGKEGIFKDIYFDFDNYDIRPDARPVLNEIASWMNKNNNSSIIIEGHCDERGTNEYNLALGEKRARVTRDYLVSLGVSPTRITVISYGEEKPQCIESTEECWQLNRRAHFVIIE